MRTDSQRHVSKPFCSTRFPQPGEIWEVSRSPFHSLVLSPTKMQQLYSEAARQFLAGVLPPRYVAIVQEAETQEEGSIVSVMVLSGETQFISSIDLLISSELSGIDQDLLAETWHVLPMLAGHLSRPVGKRLSREIYDRLLDVGDAYLGLLPETPSPEYIQSFGLQIGMADVLQLEIQEFHQREREWSDVLSVPLAVDRTERKTLEFANKIAEAALEMEQELATFLQIEEQFRDRSDRGNANRTEDFKALD
jgi:hypothetical protein